MSDAEFSDDEVLQQVLRESKAVLLQGQRVLDAHNDEMDEDNTNDQDKKEQGKKNDKKEDKKVDKKEDKNPVGSKLVSDDMVEAKKGNSMTRKEIWDLVNKTEVTLDYSKDNSTIVGKIFMYPSPFQDPLKKFFGTYLLVDGPKDNLINAIFEAWVSVRILVETGYNDTFTKIDTLLKQEEDLKNYKNRIRATINELQEARKELLVMAKAEGGSKMPDYSAERSKLANAVLKVTDWQTYDAAFYKNVTCADTIMTQDEVAKVKQVFEEGFQASMAMTRPEKEIKTTGQSDRISNLETQIRKYEDKMLTTTRTQKTITKELSTLQEMTVNLETYVSMIEDKKWSEYFKAQNESLDKVLLLGKGLKEHAAKVFQEHQDAKKSDYVKQLFKYMKTQSPLSKKLDESDPGLLLWALAFCGYPVIKDKNGEDKVSKCKTMKFISGDTVFGWNNGQTSFEKGNFHTAQYFAKATYEGKVFKGDKRAMTNVSEAMKNMYGPDGMDALGWTDNLEEYLSGTGNISGSDLYELGLQLAPQEKVGDKRKPSSSSGRASPDFETKYASGEEKTPPVASGRKAKNPVKTILDSDDE